MRLCLGEASRKGKKKRKKKKTSLRCLEICLAGDGRDVPLPARTEEGLISLGWCRALGRCPLPLKVAERHSRHRPGDSVGTISGGHWLPAVDLTLLMWSLVRAGGRADAPKGQPPVTQGTILPKEHPRLPGRPVPAPQALHGTIRSEHEGQGAGSPAEGRAEARAAPSAQPCLVLPAEQELGTLEGRKSKARKTPSPSYLLNCSEL